MASFDLERLHKILSETTVQLRKGDVFEGTLELVDQAKRGVEITSGGVLEVYAMPHELEAGQGIEKVDLEFLAIGVDKAKAEISRDEIISILTAYPQPDRLASGPSYIEVGGVIGDQGAAFQLFALGKVLGLWSIVTPRTLGFTGAEARMMAGQGFVIISGFDPSRRVAA